MIEPVRLIDGGGDALEGELLRAAAREPVPSESRASVARALGLPLAVASGQGTDGASRAAGTSPNLATTASPGAQLTGVRLQVIGKYALFGLIGGLALFAGSGAWKSRAIESGAPVVAVSEVSPPPIVVPLAPAPDTLPSVAALPPSLGLAEVPARRVASGAEQRHSAARNVANADVSQPTSADRLMAEVRQLDGVRVALRASDTERALRLLDAYSREFPGAELAHEAVLLRTRAERARAAQIRGSQGAARDIEEPR